MQNGPWWGPGLFVIASVVIAQVVLLSLDRRRTRREDQQRWDHKRQDAYVRYSQQLYRTLDHSPFVNRRMKIDQEQFAKLGYMLSELEILSSPKVWDTARQLFVFIGDAGDEDTEENEFAGRMKDAKSQLVMAIRKELGILKPGPKVAVDLSDPIAAMWTVVREISSLFFPFRWAMALHDRFGRSKSDPGSHAR